MGVASTISLSEEKLTERVRDYLDTVGYVRPQDIDLLDVLYGERDAAYLSARWRSGTMLLDWVGEKTYTGSDPIAALLDDVGIPHTVHETRHPRDNGSIRRYYVAEDASLLTELLTTATDDEALGEFLGYPPLDIQWFKQRTTRESHVTRVVHSVLRGYAAGREAGSPHHTYSYTVQTRPSRRGLQQRRAAAIARYQRAREYAEAFNEVDPEILRSPAPLNPLYWVGAAAGVVFRTLS